MELAYCGLNCGECPIYLASINQNTDEQVRLAKEYTTETCKFTKADMYCLGCHSETTSEKPKDFLITPTYKEEHNTPIFVLRFSEKIAYKVYDEF